MRARRARAQGRVVIAKVWLVTPAPPAAAAAHAGRRDGAIDGFSPGEQAPLWPNKSFGIMALVGSGRCR